MPELLDTSAKPGNNWFARFRRISFNQALLLISAVALLLRLGAAWEMSRMGGGVNNMLMPPSTSDLATYMRLAKAAAQGEFPQEFYYQPFYYAVFLPPFYLVFGKFAIAAVVVAQALLSAATVWLTGVCGAKIFDRRAGVIAAVMCAISSPLILYVPFHQNETLHTFNLIFWLFLLLKLLASHNLRWYIAAGLWGGVAIATRGNIYLLLPAVLGCMIFDAVRKKLPAAKIAGAVAVFVVGLFVVQLPFIIHNSRARGELTGASTAANAVLALGNTPEAAAGGKEPGPPGAMYYPEAYRRMLGRTAGSYAKSVPRQMWEWFCEEPLAFCELQFRKLLLFWDGIEIPNNVSLYFEGAASRILQMLILGRSTVLLTFALAGIFWLLPQLFKSKRLELWLLYGMVILYYGAVTVFYMLSRFRAPVLPLLFIFGGVLPGIWYDAWCAEAAEKRKQLFYKMLLTGLAAFFFVYAGYNFYRFYLEAAVNRTIRPEGVMLDMGGEDIHFFDHGPRPFGGWSEIEMKPGDVAVKAFAKCGSEYGTLYFSISNLEAGTVTLQLNGREVNIDLPETKPGKQAWKFMSIPVMLHEGKVVLQILNTTTRIALVCDRQRDYGRTLYNNSNPGGEWVMRFGRPR